MGAPSQPLRGARVEGGGGPGPPLVRPWSDIIFMGRDREAKVISFQPIPPFIFPAVPLKRKHIFYHPMFVG